MWGVWGRTVASQRGTSVEMEAWDNRKLQQMGKALMRLRIKKKGFNATNKTAATVVPLPVTEEN